ncbi:hypothetical protein [Salinimicrobium marinum]|uniref:hypothetical protein n=1 Tax=Salinimicrobium marinum TaxID=680283 RepID=UPI00167881E5|nr:hypothetical protein [Salinimicrobium marinum]
MTSAAKIDAIRTPLALYILSFLINRKNGTKLRIAPAAIKIPKKSPLIASRIVSSIPKSEKRRIYNRMPMLFASIPIINPIKISFLIIELPAI